MKTVLSKATRALAEGAATGKDAARILTGVHITKQQAVVSDGFLLIIKPLAAPKMELDGPVIDDGIDKVTIPSDALKACEGDEIQLQTIESLRPAPTGLLVTEGPRSKIIARLNGPDFDIEAEAIEGQYPNYQALFNPSHLVGQVCLNTKILKKVIKCLPDNAMVRFRISTPSSPVEFQCEDEDGGLPIRGIIMPAGMDWDKVEWYSKDVAET